MSEKTSLWWAAALPFDGSDLSWLPLPPPAIPIEEYRSADRYVVRVELPGVDPDRDVHLACPHGALRLRVHREGGPGERTRSEFRYGTFSRTIALPAGALTDRITARYAQGVLEITVPIGAPGEAATPIAVDATGGR